MHILEEHINDFEVWERISFKEFNCGFVPIDSDLLTLDMDYVFKQVSGIDICHQCYVHESVISAMLMEIFLASILSLKQYLAFKMYMALFRMSKAKEWELGKCFSV